MPERLKIVCKAKMFQGEMDFDDGTAEVFFIAPWFNKLAFDIVCMHRLYNMGPTSKSGRYLEETSQLLISSNSPEDRKHLS